MLLDLPFEKIKHILTPKLIKKNNLLYNLELDVDQFEYLLKICDVCDINYVHDGISLLFSLLYVDGSPFVIHDGIDSHEIQRKQIEQACSNGSIVKKIKLLIKYGIDLSIKLEEKTPLHVICDDGETPLSINDRSKIIKAFINSAIDINAQDSHGDTALHHICYNSTPGINILKLLLENGADPNIRNNDDKLPIYYCVYENEENYNEYKPILIQYGSKC